MLAVLLLQRAEGVGVLLPVPARTHPLMQAGRPARSLLSVPDLVLLLPSLSPLLLPQCLFANKTFRAAVYALRPPLAGDPIVKELR